MRFLADENCDYAVVRALRSEGHDVVAVNEFQKRSVDRELMEMAQRDERILLTEDKDFGWLAFVAHLKSPGVVLIRFPASARVPYPQLCAGSSTDSKHNSKVRSWFCAPVQFA